MSKLSMSGSRLRTGKKKTMEIFCTLLVIGSCVISTFAALPRETSRGRSQGAFSFNLDSEAKFTFKKGDKTWLQSAPAFLYTEGRKFSVEDGSLKLDHLETQSGSDKIGLWSSQCFVYTAGPLPWRVCAKRWKSPDLPLVVFQQQYINGTADSAHDADNVISGFPSFDSAASEDDLGFVSFQGEMVGSSLMAIGRWPQDIGQLSQGIVGGPITLIDQTGGTCIMAPFSEFMSTSRAIDQNRTLSWGVMGGVKTVPAGFNQQTIVYCGDTGINQVFADWGKFMRTYYDKTDVYRQSDLTINYLGYWTDNGAYYYWKTEPHTTHEGTILDLKKYFDAAQIPYRYLQYDEWFYPRDSQKRVLTWNATKVVSPHGFQYVFNLTQLAVVGHNMLWSGKTPYAKANGGQYDFVIDLNTDVSIPIDLNFWRDLFSEARLWGLTVYEQDYMDQTFLDVNALMSTVDVAKIWLVLMGQAARETGLTLQYCMSNPRHVMQALEIPVVTQARVSHDATPGSENWRIGQSSLFAHALGIAPFKDNFWTTSVQPGNGYNKSEPYPQLQAAVATLSTGPVGPSDRIGYTNKTLLMQCCRADGLILKPSKPATAIDKTYAHRVWPKGDGADGEVWTTFSHLGLWTFGIILAADVRANFQLTPSDAGFSSFQPTTLIRRFADGADPVLTSFGENTPLSLTPNCSRSNFCLYYTSPVYNVGGLSIVIFGEEMKFVPMSPQRIINIDVLQDDVILKVKGTVGETTVFTNFVNGEILRHLCTFDKTGVENISLKSRQDLV